VLLAVFAGLGLLVASVGIYGVTARSVVERTREVGVRLALGGSPGGVWRSIAQRPLGAVVAGAIAGTALSLFAAHIIAAYLPGTTGPAVSALWPAAAVLVATGGLAAVVPAYRATRIDPLRALRSE
jgi:ABC-type antimicrobial peptide transport system permease subunit